MIASLSGNLIHQDGDQLVVDVNGVGYSVSVSSSVLGTLASAPAGNGAERKLQLIIFTDVKENEIALWGFQTIGEKQVFLLLKKVSGVGSKTAMGIVSHMGTDQLLQRIGASDITALTKLPGVGKKTAERIVVELREQVGALAQGFSAHRTLLDSSTLSGKASDASSAGQSALVDAELALEKLGFSIDRARKAVHDAAQPHIAGGTIFKLSAGDLVQEALSKL